MMSEGVVNNSKAIVGAQAFDRLRRLASGLAIDVRIFDAVADLGEFGDVGAAAEVAARAGHYNHPNIGTPGKSDVDIGQAAPHRQRHRIPLVRPVERHHGNPCRIHLHQDASRS